MSHCIFFPTGSFTQIFLVDGKSETLNFDGYEEPKRFSLLPCSRCAEGGCVAVVITATPIKQAPVTSVLS